MISLENALYCRYMSKADAGPTDRLVQAMENAQGILGKGASERRLGSLGKLEVPAEAIRALPLEFVKRHRILPIGLHNGTIEIATAEPGNQRVIEDIRLLSGLEVQEFEAPVAEILEKSILRITSALWHLKPLVVSRIFTPVKSLV